MREFFENLVEDEIIDITEEDYEYTVDIETDGDHLFFANNILTHNSSVEEVEFDHSHISGGISKINTADNLIGIFTSRAMRERGRYQLQLMKTRSSSGVNSKIDLAFDTNTLRITDLEENEEETNTAPGETTGNILDRVKRKNTETQTDFTDTTPRDDPADGKPVGRVRAETDSTKLREFLNNLK